VNVLLSKTLHAVHHSMIPKSINCCLAALRMYSFVPLTQKKAWWNSPAGIKERTKKAAYWKSPAGIKERTKISQRVRDAWAGLSDVDLAARLKLHTAALERGHATDRAALVERRDGEEDIYREILAMNPRMTPTKIDEFITAPSNHAPQREYKQIRGALHLQAARAAADAIRPDGTSPISDAAWRTMQLEEQWVKYLSQNPGKVVLQDRAQRVLSLLRTLSHIDQKTYIGWIIRERASKDKSYAKKELKKKPKRL
jgi:hypothetical protein